VSTFVILLSGAGSETLAERYFLFRCVTLPSLRTGSTHWRTLPNPRTVPYHLYAAKSSRVIRLFFASKNVRFLLGISAQEAFQALQGQGQGIPQG